MRWLSLREHPISGSLIRVVLGVALGTATARLVPASPAFAVIVAGLGLAMVAALVIASRRLPTPWSRKRCYICDAPEALPLPVQPETLRWWQSQDYQWVCEPHVKTWLSVQIYSGS